MRAYELRQYDVISYYPPATTQEEISNWRTYFY